MPAGDAKARLVKQNLEKDFIKGQEGGLPLKTLVEMQKLRIL